MSSILTLRTNGPALNTGWFPITGPYTQADIESIKDPSSNGETLLLTSIPSPFARFHLFNTAFDMVNASGHAPASPNAYHELVSHSLDLLEICFNFQGLETSLNYQGSSLRIAPYNLQEAADRLSNGTGGHRLTGETLATFFAQDGESANFNRSTPFFLVILGGKVIGVTSPLTVFATVEDLSIPPDVTLNRSDGSAYFKTVRALHEREAAFQLYVHRFVAAYRNFYSERTPAFYNYVFGSYQKHMVGNQGISGVYTNMYQPAQLGNDYEAVVQGNHALNILGMQFYGRLPLVIDAGTSHFIIQPTVSSVEGMLPMVLVPGKDQPGRIYAGAVSWDRANAKNAMGFSDTRPIQQRTLPGIGHPYPYLTVNDLLQDSIVQMEYENDGDFFANGGYDGRDTGRSFLFPVTETFFKYFCPQDLTRMCVITENKLQADGKEQSVITVTLSIPTSDGIGQQITRNYVDKPSKGNTENLGKTVKNSFNLSIFPFYRVTTQAFSQYNDRYRVKFEKSGNDLLTFYGPNMQLIPRNLDKRVTTPRHYSYERVSSGQGVRGIDMYAVENSEIELIMATVSDQRDASVQATGFILPLFKGIDISSNNADHYKVAIDFGTTNSHVELKLVSANANPEGNDTVETPLVLKAEENMVGHLGPVQTNAEHFIPDVIGEPDRSGILRYRFPTRTVINERPNNQDFEVLVGTNILFPYEKEALDMVASSPRTNLKWSIGNRDTASEERVAAFLEQLMLMVRAKVITRGLNPAKTKVTWFYPLNMGPVVRGFLHGKWGQIYKEIFKSQDSGLLRDMSESEAPYYYHVSELNNLNNSVVLCADIGGGTTDYVFFEGGSPRYAFSAFFGGNVLYGTGYVTTLAHNMRNNFVQRHQEAIKDRISALPKGDRQSGLKKMFNGMLEGTASSADIVSFFFSNEDDFHYTEMLLADSRSKVIFLLYYGAIIYHAGQVLKQKDLAAPQYICFSGNGSKMLNCIEADINGSRPKLDQLTRELLKRCGVKQPENFEHIRSASQPKEATCKGALLYEPGQNTKHQAIEPMVHLGADQLERPANITYAQIKADSQLKSDVTASVNRFVELLLQIHDDGTMNFKSAFKADPSKFNLVREVFQKQTGNFMESGLNSLSKNGVSDEDQVVEPLFFYPFIGALYEINQKV